MGGWGWGLRWVWVGIGVDVGEWGVGVGGGEGLWGLRYLRTSSHSIFGPKWYTRVPVRFFALLTVPETTAIEPDQNTTNTACSLVSPFTMPKPKEPSFLFRPSYVSATKRNQNKQNKTKHKGDILYFAHRSLSTVRETKQNETKIQR